MTKDHGDWAYILLADTWSAMKSNGVLEKTAKTKIKIYKKEKKCARKENKRDSSKLSTYHSNGNVT